MNHDHYVALAYAVFAVVLAWDYLSPKLQLRRVIRAIRLRGRRQGPRSRP